MGKNRYRRQVGGKTSGDDSIQIPGVSANGNATVNARAKGCFGKSTAEKKGYKPLSPYKMKRLKKARKAGKK
jgi:hypothetical protein